MVNESYNIKQDAKKWGARAEFFCSLGVFTVLFTLFLRNIEGLSTLSNVNVIKQHFRCTCSCEILSCIRRQHKYNEGQYTKC